MGHYIIIILQPFFSCIYRLIHLNLSVITPFLFVSPHPVPFRASVRVNVASLVTVLQMGRMEYLTEVMRCLMVRLVSSAAATKHPQLMLRRTESVVEKMLTNWMALCMYNYLKVCVCVCCEKL